MNGNELSIGVNAFVGLMALALVLSMLAQRAGVPAAVVLVAAGTIIGNVWHVRPPFDFGQTLLFIFLPPLIFEAAWNVDLQELRRVWKQVLFLAFPGTVFVAFAIAWGISLRGAVPFDVALLYGAMVAATDPVAVVAVFRKFAVPARLKTIVEVESIANDGVAVVLYSTALMMLAGGNADWIAAGSHGVIAILAGIAIGYLGAFAAWWFLRTTATPEYEVTTTVALAYASYLIADHLSVSGIFASASAGIVLRALQRRRDGIFVSVIDADRFWSTAAYIANAAVFIATGLLIDFPRMLHEPELILTAVAIVFISRFLLVWAVLRDLPARLTAFLAGMRGALPLALALSLPASLRYRAAIIDAVFATVFVTLVLQGLPLEPLVKRLYPSSAGSEAGRT